jgi:inosine-uridine nucleoside N-ribohydrolase
MTTPKQLNRRRFLQHASFLAGAATVLSLAPDSAGAASRVLKPRPVILATDIGDDIDDSWALGFLLKCPELDLKLVVGDYGKRQYRARLAAKLLQRMRARKIPIGIGMDIEPRGDGPQAGWVGDYDLNSYPGKIYPDGVQAIIDTVMKSRELMTIISIGPMPNVAAALRREPRIAGRARLVGMYGSIRKGYGGASTPSAEWNVKADPKACQTALTAPWDITITPLDTCGLVTLEGEQYSRVRGSDDPVASTVVANYRIWSRANKAKPEIAETRSSVLFDTVAVYLAFSQSLCTMERLGVRVTDDGFTRIDDRAKKMLVATDWKSLDGYREFLVKRLTN